MVLTIDDQQILINKEDCLDDPNYVSDNYYSSFLTAGNVIEITVNGYKLKCSILESKKI